jgi:alpha-amylase
MAKFRNVAGNEPVKNWWDNKSNQIAFSRGKKAFLVINNDDYPMEVSLKTGLPSGFYCDIISGNKINTKCTGRKIFIDQNGNANISISNSDYDPFIAIHIESKLL